MNISLENVRNIKNANISLKKNVLNIKYGMNGVGKSSIVLGLEYKIKQNKDLEKYLKPFSNQNAEIIVNGIEDINSIEIFNEDFVNNFLFKEDELIENSYEVFVKNKVYDKLVKDVDKHLMELSNLSTNNNNLNNYKMFLHRFIDSTEPKKDGDLKANKLFLRSMKKGNIVDNIPDDIEVYKDLLGNVNWIDWHFKGEIFQKSIEICPYCSGEIADNQQDVINLIHEHYDKRTVKAITDVKEIVNNLDGLIIGESKEKIEDIHLKKDELEKEEHKILVGLNAEAVLLYDKIEQIQSLNHYTLRSFDKNELDKIMKSYKIDLNEFPNFKGNLFVDIVNEINTTLDKIIERTGELKGLIAMLTENLNKTIENKEDDINEFLRLSGFKYSVEIPKNEPSHKILLRPSKSDDIQILEPRKHLSFGERNIFALVLFVHKVIKENTDLIVLDDPVSSFDKNKKFFIMHYLFNNQDKLRNKTVLLLTHDYEPVLDFKKIVPNVFESNAHYITNIDGIMKEQEINKSDILSFFDITLNNAKTHSDNILKLIHLRRYYEIKRSSCDVSKSCFEYISNILHRRDKPIDSDKNELTAELIATAEKEISNYIDFEDYSTLFALVEKDTAIIKSYNDADCNYDKIHLFRLLIEGKNNDIGIPVMKFIHGTYHPEGEYVYELNPLKFDRIPDNIIEECNRYIRKEYGSYQSITPAR